MEYKKTVNAIFIKRINRFMAQVILDGHEENVHVRNTGRCKELLQESARVILEDVNRPNRKTRYSLVGVWKQDMLVNLDSQIPNDVVEEALQKKKILPLKHVKTWRRESSFLHSRFDFELIEPSGFLEVKGVTLEEDGVAMFPDAPTSRGKKHVDELIEVKKLGKEAYLFFLVQMKGPTKFMLNWKMDPAFSKAVVNAAKNGVKIDLEKIL